MATKTQTKTIKKPKSSKKQKVEQNGNGTPGEAPEQNNLPVETLTKILIQEISPSDSNPQTHRRKRFTNENLAELAASIKTNGLVNPITIRPRNWTPEFVPNSRAPKAQGGYWGVLFNKGKPDWCLRHIGKNSESEAQAWCDEHRYEIVAGERRYLAAKLAGLTEIAVVLKDLDDAQMLEIQLIENVQREDVNPVDEALWYHEMQDKQGWTTSEIGIRVGKTERYVRHRLQMMALLPEILSDVENGFLPMGHALELAKLDEDYQRQLYPLEVYDTNWTPQGHVPDKDDPVTFQDLKRSISEVFYELSSAYFDLKNKNLHPAGLQCGNCPERTGAAGTLFEEYKLADGDRCLNSMCFERKSKMHLQNLFERRTATIRKDFKLDDDFMPVMVTNSKSPIEQLLKWFPNNEVLEQGYRSEQGDYACKVVGDHRRGECTGEEQAVWMDWRATHSTKLGDIVPICRPASCCPVHWAEGGSSSAYGQSKKRMDELTPEEQEKRRRENGARRQQILDSQVFHATAPPAFRDVCVKFGENNTEMFDSMVQGDFHFQLTWMFYMLKKGDSGLANWLVDNVVKHWVKKGEYKTLSNHNYSMPDYHALFELLDQKIKVAMWFGLTRVHTVRYYDDDLKPEDMNKLYELCDAFEVEWIGYDAQARVSMTPAKYAKETGEYAALVKAWLELGDGNGKPEIKPVRPFVYATDKQKEEMRKAALSVQVDEEIKESKSRRKKAKEPPKFEVGERVVWHQPLKGKDAGTVASFWKISEPDAGTEKGERLVRLISFDKTTEKRVLESQLTSSDQEAIPESLSPPKFQVGDKVHYNDPDEDEENKPSHEVWDVIEPNVRVEGDVRFVGIQIDGETHLEVEEHLLEPATDATAAARLEEQDKKREADWVEDGNELD